MTSSLPSCMGAQPFMRALPTLTQGRWIVKPSPIVIMIQTLAWPRTTIAKSGPQVQKLDPRIPMKVVVKGDQAAATRRRERGKVRVGPFSSAQVKLPGPLP